MKAIDLFAGPGGWDEGARPLDLHEHIAGFDIDKAACATAEAAGHPRVKGDLSKIEPGRYVAGGLIASPPCQGFSPAGSGRGRDDFRSLGDALVEMGLWVLNPRAGQSPDQAIATLAARCADKRSALILEPMRWLLGMSERPRWVLLEQVRTCLPIWRAYSDVLSTLGYSVWTGIVHADQYGVPQTRTRAVLIASLDRDVSAGPTPTHSRYYPRDPARLDPGVQPWVSMADALGPDWVPEAAVDGDTSWAFKRPAVTVVGSFAPDVMAAPGWRKPGDGPRQKAPGSIRITVQEAGVLQSFPPDYPWQGSRSMQYQQVGNAVPPKLATVLLSTVLGRV